MEARKPNPETASPLVVFPAIPIAKDGRLYPTEVRALIDILARHLQRQLEHGDVARLRNTASADPHSYMLFFDDVYLGSITRLPAKGDEEQDEFLFRAPEIPG